MKSHDFSLNWETWLNFFSTALILLQWQIQVPHGGANPIFNEIKIMFDPFHVEKSGKEWKKEQIKEFNADKKNEDKYDTWGFESTDPGSTMNCNYTSHILLINFAIKTDIIMVEIKVTFIFIIIFPLNFNE